VKDEPSGFDFVPSPQIPLPFDDLGVVMIHVILIKGVVKNFGAEFLENLGEKVKGFLDHSFYNVWKVSYKAKKRCTESLMEMMGHISREIRLESLTH
jgi:hypothetical protein